MKKKYKYFIIFGASALLLSFFIYIKLNSPRTYKSIQSSGVLHVGINYSSTGYFLQGDSLQGFQYELVKVLCDSLHLRPEFVVENNFDKSIQLLKNGKIDVLASNIPVTTALSGKVLFTSAIICTKPLLIQRRILPKESRMPIRSQLDLAGKTIYVSTNSPYILRINNLAKEIGDTISVQEVPNYDSEQLIAMVAKGDIDYAVCDEQIAKVEKAAYPQIDILTAIGFPQMQAWVLPLKSVDLQLKINQFFDQFLKTKAYRDIYRKYYR